MATEAQVLANRLNAQKSTGPRTEAGKATVSQNAVTHGLLGRKTVISGEDPGEFEFYREQLLAELHPAGAMEAVLAERIVGLAWRLRRADRLQAEVFDTMLAKDDTPVSRRCRSWDYEGSKDGPDPRDSALGRVVIKDFANYRVLDRLGLYERRIEYSLYRTMGELEKVRHCRAIDPPMEEPTPEPAEAAGEERSCETKPISETQQGQGVASLRQDGEDGRHVGACGGPDAAGGLAFTGLCGPVKSTACTNSLGGYTGPRTGPVTGNRELA